MVFLDALVFTKPGVMVGGRNTKVDTEAGSITDEQTKTFINAPSDPVWFFCPPRCA